MKTLKLSKMWILAVGIAIASQIVVGQSSSSTEIVHLPDYLPVRDLVAAGRVTTQVVDRQTFDDRIEVELVMTNDKGRTIGGYAMPYVQAGQDVVSLWREYIQTHLNISATDDRISVREERRAQDKSFSVAFVLDHSPSMTMPRAIRMQRAVRQAMSVFERDDRVSVVKFTSRVKTEVPLSNSKEEYMEKFAINGINFRDDGTAIYDASMEGLRQISQAPEAAKRILVVFTDGEDNSSKATLEAVRTAAEEAHATIYAVTYGVADDKELADLARSTGGRIHRLHDVYDFDKVFLGIYNGLRHSYIVQVDHRSKRGENDLFTGAVEPTSTGYGSIAASEILPRIAIRDVKVNEDLTTSERLAIALPLEYLETSDLHPQDVGKLDALATLLIQRNDLSVEILNSGARNEDQDAMRRTQALRELLVRRGVDPSRVQGFGRGREGRRDNGALVHDAHGKTTFVFTKL